MPLLLVEEATNMNDYDMEDRQELGAVEPTCVYCGDVSDLTICWLCRWLMHDAAQRHQTEKENL